MTIERYQNNYGLTDWVINRDEWPSTLSTSGFEALKVTTVYREREVSNGRTQRREFQVVEKRK